MLGTIIFSEGYFTSICSISPPLSTKAAATIFRQDSTAPKSRPVTSMSTSVVSSVIVVNAPLIIGGIEATSSLESVISGYSLNSSKRWAYSIPFGCSFRISSGVIS